MSTHLARRLHAFLLPFLFALMLGVGAVATVAVSDAASIVTRNTPYASGVKAETNNGVTISASYIVGKTLFRTWWADGYEWTHATGAYHFSNGAVVSDAPGWVPNTYSVVPTTYAPQSVWQDAQRKFGGTVSLAVTTNVPQPAPKQGGAAVTTATYSTAHELCQSTNFWAANVSAWAVPPGCYGTIYRPNPANYPARPSVGWCNWWAEEMNPQYTGYNALHSPAHSAPRPGAVIFYSPGVDGASSDGHYGVVVAIRADGWMLTAEENFYWRGGGFYKVDYRYVHEGRGLTYHY